MGMGSRIIKNLVGGYATRLKPREPFEGTRGHIEIDIDKCTFCMRCMIQCPSSCISVNNKEGTWTMNPYECVACGVCVESCVFGALRMEKMYRLPSHSKEIMSYKGLTPAQKRAQQQQQQQQQQKQTNAGGTAQDA
jgi:formate hydrogenlyase subunit 6/NADH:ubiquinone oxidoreductase subunit I